MDELAKKHEDCRFFFVLEGVAMYFEEAIFSEFFANLAKRFKGVVALDLLNKFFAKRDIRKHDTLKHMKEKQLFKLGIDSPSEVEAWGGAIKFAKCAAMMNMYRRRWGLAGLVLSMIPKFRNSCKMFVFEICTAKSD